MDQDVDMLDALQHHQQPIASTSNLNHSSPNVSLSPSSSPPPPVFLPPLAVEPLHFAPFNSSQDLLGRFHLLPAYKKHVAPHVVPVDQWSSSTSASVSQQPPPPPPPASPTAKGKEKEVPGSNPGVDGSVVDGNGAGAGIPVGIGEEEKKKRKRENSYKHLIKNIVGKHSMKKDDYLMTTMAVPPKQKMVIKEFDGRTQRDAFWVSLEGLKGFNAHALIQESDQAREDRKRRKEARKAERARVVASTTIGPDGQPVPMTPQQQQGQQPQQSSLASTNGGGTVSATAGLSSSGPPPTTAPFTAPTPALTPGVVHAASTPGQHGQHGSPPQVQGQVSTQSQQQQQRPPPQQQQQQQQQQQPSNPPLRKTPFTPSTMTPHGQSRGLKRPASPSPALLGTGGGVGTPRQTGIGTTPISVAQKKRRVDGLPGTPIAGAAGRTGGAAPPPTQQARSAQYVQ